MDSFRGRTIDVQVSLLSVTIHLLSFPSFGWRTNVALSCGREAPVRSNAVLGGSFFVRIHHGAESPNGVVCFSIANTAFVGTQ